MIFLGDIAVNSNSPIRIKNLPGDISNTLAVANLEGGIVQNNLELQKKKYVYNSAEVVEYLKLLNVKVVTLANNHIFDINASIKGTQNVLRTNRVKFLGAGSDLDEASQPAIIKIGNQNLLFLAFSWKVINSKIAKNNSPGVNPLAPEHVLNSIEKSKKDYPDHKIILLLHWNYESELYPQPMHRELAQAAIDQGANGVIGSHSHIVQGIEIYKDSPIAYCLGNWLFPQNTFWGGKLKFDQISTRELAFEWNFDDNSMMCHWFDFDTASNNLIYDFSEPLIDSEYITKLTPYRGLNKDEYVSWFNTHRRKKVLLPIYRDINSNVTNTIKDSWVMIRNLLISILLKLKLKK